MTALPINGLMFRVEDIHVKVKFLGDGMAQVQGSFTIVVVAPAQPLTMTPPGGSLPQETVGVATTDTVATIAGGTGPYTFGLASGSLPPGVTLVQTVNADGSVTITLSGAPTQAGSFQFVLLATDSGA